MRSGFNQKSGILAWYTTFLDRTGCREEDSEDGHAVLGQQRSTLCVSSQVGCQMGCTFCATGECQSIVQSHNMLMQNLS